MVLLPREYILMILFQFGTQHISRSYIEYMLIIVNYDFIVHTSIRLPKPLLPCYYVRHHEQNTNELLLLLFIQTIKSR